MPIQLPFDMTMIFEAKVKIAKDIKAEFQEILSRHSDKFTKTMGADLKKIVLRASKDHCLEMKTEQKIVDNIGTSEEWFIATFEKLKKIAGKALNQVDFKNYQQLAQVLNEEKDCDQLLRVQKPDLLVGAAKNLWRSLSGVKWLFEVRRLMLNNQQQDLAKIAWLDQKATDLQLSSEIMAQQDNRFYELQEKFQGLREFAKEYYSKFGNHKKCLATLEEYKDKLEELIKEIGDYELKFVELKSNQQSEEIKTLQKMHTYATFSLEYSQNQLQQDQITQEKAMLLQSLAREKHIPDDIPILKKLNESVAKFERFRKDYADYRRFRERQKKQKADSLVINQNDARYSKPFVKKLLDQASRIEIQMTPDYFNREQLENDLEYYDKWKEEADIILGQLQETESAIEDKQLKAKFDNLKANIYLLPVFDKEILINIQAFDWLYICIENLNTTKTVAEGGPLTIGSWESLIKQADNLSNQFVNVQDHSVYQRLLWEVDQAKEVISFTQQAKNLSKSLAAKFNQDKAHSYSFFRNKCLPIKLINLQLVAKNSKVDLLEEKRRLDIWVKDYERIKELFKNDNFYDEQTYDKLKEILKTMFFSPIEYGDLYYDLKNKMDSAEQIKQNLKAILQEHQFAVIQRQKEQKGGSGKVKRLRYSRLSHDIKQFNKECKIKGVREIDQVIQQVQTSKDKLNEVTELLKQMPQLVTNEEKENLLNQANKLYSEVEIDMESLELDVKRQLFEEGFRLLLDHQSVNKKVQVEEFKEIEHQYDLVKNSLKDEQIHAKYLETKNKVHDILRKINRLEKKEDLAAIQETIQVECPFIDFTQLLADKDAEFLLGKRKERPSQVNQKINLEMNNDDEDEEEEEGKEMGLGFLGKNKRLKSSNGQNEYDISDVDEQKDSTINKAESSSSSQSSSSSSSSENSSSEGSSSSEDDSNEKSSESKQKSENESSLQQNKKAKRKSGKESANSSSSSSSSSDNEDSENIAQNRARRTIVPKMNTDFIYDKSTSKTQQNLQQAPPKVDDQVRKLKKQAKKVEKLRKQKVKELKKREEKAKRKRIEKEDKDLAEEKELIIQPRVTGVQKLFRQHSNQLNISAGLSIQEMELQFSLKNMKNKIRDQSRQKMSDCLTQLQLVVPLLDKDIIRNLIEELESDMFHKHPDVDHTYKKKLTDMIENLRYLLKYKEVVDLLLVKRQIPLIKIFLANSIFSELVQNIQKSLNEKKQQKRELLFQKRQEEKKQRQLQKLLNAQNEVEIPEHQQLMSTLYNSSNENKQIDTASHTQQMIIKTLSDDSDIDDEDDDLESLDSNPAQFSDEDIMNDEAKSNSNKSSMDMLQGYNNNNSSNSNQQQQKIEEYDPSQTMKVGGGIGFGGQDSNWIGSYNTTIQKYVQYNPYEAISKYQNNKFGQKKSQEPILYDPLKIRTAQKVGVQKVKNSAPPGSLLKVWEGTLECSKDLLLQCQFNSTQDIQMFQNLPELQPSLQLKGKAKASEVVTHFMRLKNDKRLLKGWVIRKSASNQENNDKYTKLFDELEQTQKTALFEIFPNVNIYLIPLNKSTRDFCLQMGIHTENVPNKQNSSLGNIKFLEKQNDIETHCFAFISQIKQVFNTKTNYLNPEVLIHRELPVKAPKVQQVKNSTQNEKGYSPISSDDEGAKKHKQKVPIQSLVKNEEINQVSNQQQEISKSIKVQDPENTPMIIDSLRYDNRKAEDEIDIDDLIQGFKNKDYDIALIQQKLMPIIHKVKGEQEVKLTAFLQELIKSHGQGASQSQNQIIKQEPLTQPMNNYQMSSSISAPSQMVINQSGISLQMNQSQFNQPNKFNTNYGTQNYQQPLNITQPVQQFSQQRYISGQIQSAPQPQQQQQFNSQQQQFRFQGGQNVPQQQIPFQQNIRSAQQINPIYPQQPIQQFQQSQNSQFGIYPSQGQQFNQNFQGQLNQPMQGGMPQIRPPPIQMNQGQPNLAQIRPQGQQLGYGGGVYQTGQNMNPQNNQNGGNQQQR